MSEFDNLKAQKDQILQRQDDQLRGERLKSRILGLIDGFEAAASPALKRSEDELSNAEQRIRELEARLTAKDRTIDGFWVYAANAWDMEDRKYFEEHFGVEKSLLMAAHHTWKRDPQPDALSTEKATRIKYQDIVYSVCNILDVALGNSVSRGTGLLAEKEEITAALNRALKQPDALAELERDAKRGTVALHVTYKDGQFVAKYFNGAGDWHYSQPRLRLHDAILAAIKEAQP